MQFVRHFFLTPIVAMLLVGSEIEAHVSNNVHVEIYNGSVIIDVNTTVDEIESVGSGVGTTTVLGVVCFILAGSIFWCYKFVLVRGMLVNRIQEQLNCRQPYHHDEQMVKLF